MSYTEENRKAFDRRARSGWRWAKPITREEYMKAENGELRLFLTPNIPVPREWFPENLSGLDVLGLASAGGQQMPILAAFGASCTVMDISPEMLERDRMVAERESITIKIVEADMTERFPFEDDSFDMIVFPVALCYVKDCTHVWKECARVLRKGGLLLSGQDAGLNYLFDESGKLTGTLPYDPLEDKKLYDKCIADGCGIQFSHSLSELIGDQIKAGFTIERIYTDTNPDGVLHDHGVPSFVATRAFNNR